MCPAQRWAMPEASKAYASWRAPGTGSPTSTSRPAVLATTCTLNPHSWCLSENMFASAWGRSPVGAMNPSTSSGASDASADLRDQVRVDRAQQWVQHREQSRHAGLGTAECAHNYGGM